MKNLLTLAIVLSTATAYSYTTRARNAALQNSPHIADFYSPENLHMSANTLTIESGSTTAAQDATTADTDDAVEGTFVKSTDLGVFGLTLGHQDDIVFDQRAASGIANIKGQQNPIQFGFGTKMADFNVGAALVYSNYENKSADEKESTMGLKLGMSNSLFYVNGSFMFADKYELAATEYKGKLGMDIKAGYNISEDLSVHGRLTNSAYEVGAQDAKLMALQATVIHSVKLENANFFYGAGLMNASGENLVGDDIKALALPVIIGLEATANSWLTVRASITQDVILSNSEAGAVELSPGLNTTTVAAGAGLNFGKITVDGTLLSGGTQNLDAGNLLAQVGVRYNF